MIVAGDSVRREMRDGSRRDLSRRRVDGVEVDAMIQHERAVILISTQVTRHLRYPTMVQTRDDLEESRSLFLMRVSSEISAKLALMDLPDDDGMRSPSRARTLSV